MIKRGWLNAAAAAAAEYFRLHAASEMPPSLSQLCIFLLFGGIELRINTFAGMPFERASNSLKVLYLLPVCSVIPPPPRLTPIHTRALCNGNMSHAEFPITVETADSRAFRPPKKLKNRAFERDRWLARRYHDPANAGESSWPQEEGGTF